MMANAHNYGLTAKKQLELFALVQNPQLKRRSHYISLHDNSRRYALHAVELAKAGDKDAARNWHRYFEQSSIHDLLKESGEIPDNQIAEFRLLLADLKNLCHPQEQISLETDLLHIRAMLERLVELNEQRNAPFFPFADRTLQRLVTRN